MLRFYSDYIIPLSALFAITIALRNYKYLTSPFKIIFWFTVFSQLTNMINIILAHQGIYTTFIFHIYTIFEFCFLSLFYLQLFGKRWRKIVIPLIAVFSLLCICNFLFIQNKIEYNTYTRPIEVIMIMVYGMLFINKQNDMDENSSWSSNGLNWINTGILVYYVCCLFIFIFTNYLIKTSEGYMYNIVWAMYCTLLIAEYVLFAVGFYKCREEKELPLV